VSLLIREDAIDLSNMGEHNFDGRTAGTNMTPLRSDYHPAMRETERRQFESPRSPQVDVFCTAMSAEEKLRHDKADIREVIENWVIFRDAAMWDQFKTVWHDDGYMMATWFQGSATEFIRVSREGFERGVSILHFLGGSNVEIATNRAIAQTKMTITQRASVHDTLVEVVCTGRFYDFFEKRNEKWAIVLRRLFYEKDRMDVVDPATQVTLEPELLASFPVGYQHLAYLQTKLGFNVKKNMPGLRGPEAQALYAHGANWLAGRSIVDAKK